MPVRWERASIISGPSAFEIWPGATALFGPAVSQESIVSPNPFCWNCLSRPPKPPTTAPGDGSGGVAVVSERGGTGASFVPPLIAREASSPSRAIISGFVTFPPGTAEPEDVVEQSHCDLLTNAQGFELLQEEDILEPCIKLGNRWLFNMIRDQAEANAAASRIPEAICLRSGFKGQPKARCGDPSGCTQCSR